MKAVIVVALAMFMMGFGVVMYTKSQSQQGVGVGEHVVQGSNLIETDKISKTLNADFATAAQRENLKAIMLELALSDQGAGGSVADQLVNEIGCLVVSVPVPEDVFYLLSQVEDQVTAMDESYSSKLFQYHSYIREKLAVEDAVFDCE